MRFLAPAAALLLISLPGGAGHECIAAADGDCSAAVDEDGQALMQSSQAKRASKAAAGAGSATPAREKPELRDRLLLGNLAAKRDVHSDKDSEVGVTEMAQCFGTCLNFLSSSHEEDCDACTAELAKGVRTTPIGANSVALGYAQDLMGIKLKHMTYAEAWCGGDVANCSEKKNFPGPGTTSIMGWDNVAALNAQMPQKEWSGEWWRGNELGGIINNPFFWSSSGVDPMSNVLGALPSQHAAIRPLMEEMFAVGRIGSARYDEAQRLVNGAIKKFLADRMDRGLNVLEDIRILVHIILNLVAFGREVTWKYAKDFIKVQQEVVALGTLSQIMPSVLYGLMEPIRKKVADYTSEYAGLIRERWNGTLATEDCSPSKDCVQQAASMVWDAFYSAGGLSVPSTISTGIGLLFSTDTSSPFPGANFSKDEALQFYWENVRYFPPVVGFPHWETRPTCAGSTAAATLALNGTGGTTKTCPLGASSTFSGYPEVNQYQGGVRVVSNIALANVDPKKWGPDAGEFVIRPIEEYREKSLGFAEGAEDNSVAQGRMNRVCPGKTLALMIGGTFFTLFDKNDWIPPHDAIKFLKGPTFVSSFTMTSKKMVKECKEICPSCGVDIACLTKLAKCEKDKAHCSLCRDCDKEPPSWWNLPGQIACQTC